MSRRDLPPRQLSEEERHLWQQVTAEARPLPTSPAVLAPPVPVIRRAEIQSTPPALPLRSVPMPEGAIDPQSKRRLRRGALTPEARLDLHGLNEAAAFAQLSRFIEHCVRADKRFVLVITGKGAMGRGKLRETFPKWLEVAPLRHFVQAYEPAQPRDGGTGAFYVKLRRVKE